LVFDGAEQGMRLRFGIALAVCFLASSSTFSQVVRFQTTVGDFDMVLNPGNNPVLQEHVDNMLAYVENGNYKGSWINRAPDGFVLQMGGFFSNTKRPPLTIDSVRSVASFGPIEGAPAVDNDLSNTAGTVALALSGLPTGGTNQDSGSSSFFINVGSNTFLDPDFTVFAAIPDMTVVNEIMALTKTDLSDESREPPFGVDPGNLAFSDVPLTAAGFQVFIKRAFVISDTLEAARVTAGVQSVLAESASAFGDGSVVESLIDNGAGSATMLDGGSASAGLLSNGAVPEPASISILLLSALASLALRRRQ
jgi:cyclophilin family peptidyl-prolyl cis-trans isomerase